MTHGFQIHQSLPDTVTKAVFADLVGLTKGRISQLIKSGLPVETTGKIDVARGRCWIQDNVDQRRGKASVNTLKGSVKDRRDEVQLERDEIELAKLKGELIERKVVERTVYAQSRAERDAWQTWPLRVVAEMAGELGIEEGLLLPVLRNLVRVELERLAQRPEAAKGSSIDG